MSYLGAPAPVGSAQRNPMTTGIETPMMRYQREQAAQAAARARVAPAPVAPVTSAPRVSVTNQATTRAPTQLTRAPRPATQPRRVAPVLVAAPGVAEAQSAFMPDGPPASIPSASGYAPVTVVAPETIPAPDSGEVTPVVVREEAFSLVTALAAQPWWMWALVGGGAYWFYSRRKKRKSR